MNDKNKKVSEEISYYIRPSTFPLAVKMLENAEHCQFKAKRPKRDLGINMMLCQAVGVSRRHGTSLLLTIEDICCPNALFFLGFVEPIESYWQGKIAFTPYTQTEEARARRSRSLAFFSPHKYKGLLIAPLFKADFEPDAIMIYGRPAQMMRFVQAATFRTGDPLKYIAQSGGSCALEIVKPILENELAMVLPGNGERIFGLIQDDEMAFTIPMGKIGEIVTGLKESHAGGQRYPITTFGHFTPPMPPSYDALLKTLRKEE